MRKRRGFTLIELLVVVAIIGILATVVVVNVSNAQKKTRDARRKSDLTSLKTAIDLYQQDRGSIPETDIYINTIGVDDPDYTESTNTLFTALTVDTNYMSKIPCDPMLTGHFCNSGGRSGNTFAYFYIVANHLTPTRLAARANAVDPSACVSDGSNLSPDYATVKDAYYSLYAQLESPSSEDRSTIQNGCNINFAMLQFIRLGTVDGQSGWNWNKDVNYRVGP